MVKHLPGVIWSTRLKGPHQIVSTSSLAKIKISFMPGDGRDGLSFFLLRKDARLLAKRINQCLNETK